MGTPATFFLLLGGQTALVAVWREVKRALKDPLRVFLETVLFSIPPWFKAMHQMDNEKEAFTWRARSLVALITCASHSGLLFTFSRHLC